MTLIVEVVSVLMGGALLATYVRAPVPRAAGVAIGAIAIAVLLALTNGFALVRSFPPSISANAALTPAQAEDLPAVAAGTTWNQVFLIWADSYIASSSSGNTFWLPPQSQANPFIAQWASYVLFPAVQVANVADAHWIVFYGVEPTHVTYPRSGFRRPITFQPDYAIAERVHAN